MTDLPPRRCVENALILGGHREDAARAAMDGLIQYLRYRIVELRAEEQYAVAKVYQRVINELLA